MDNANTVTIPIEEYFDLREKANMNVYLMERFGFIERQFNDIEKRLWEIERRADNG